MVTRHNFFCFILHIILMVLGGETVALAQDHHIKEVLAVGPSWDTFTNKDGTGLYHETLEKVFGQFGITVKREYMPSVRGRLLVAGGKADLMTCYAYETIAPPLARPKYPMYVGKYHVFFNKNAFPDWKGLDSMRERSVVWRMDYYNLDSLGIPMKVTEVKTGIAALDMVVLGRVDFYLEDKTLINESARSSKLAFNRDDFRVEAVGKRRYYPVFNTSERGRKLMALFERGMEKIIRSGELKKIFKKWGHDYPEYVVN